MDDVTVLSDRQLRELTAAELTGNRQLMRDFHYTLEQLDREGRKIPLSQIEFSVKTDTPDLSSTGYYTGFFLSSDPGHVYFFDHGWPMNFEGFLRPQDIIPSGYETLDESSQALAAAFEKMRGKNPTFLMVKVTPEELEDILKTRGPIKQMIIDRLVRVPIENIEDLELAVYAGDKNAIEYLPRLPIMFTKALKRADGRRIEQFNHIGGKWEAVEGKPNFRLAVFLFFRGLVA